MRKLLAVCICLLLASGCAGKQDNKPDESASVRHPNLSTISVQHGDMVYEVKGQTIYLDGEPVDTGKLMPAEKTSLSVIDNTIYVHSDLGLQRYNIETRITEPMYYDIMDFSFAGLHSIFFLNNNDLYSATAPREVNIVEHALVDDAYFINGNHFYFVAGDMVKALDLVTEKVEDLHPITSPIVGIEVGEGHLIISTLAGDVEVKFIDQQ